MTKNIEFCNGDPKLSELKDQYYKNILFFKPSNSDACKEVAALINPNINNCDSTLKYTKNKKQCVLYYHYDNDYRSIMGIVLLTKGAADGYTYIFIDDISAFNGAGKELLEFIIFYALLFYKYKYVYLEAASTAGNRSSQEKLIEYYERIKPNSKVNILTNKSYVYYYLCENKQYLPVN